ncbi:hypothetical protein MIR68_007856 [Amoeboaphelidium protococcarum]|nr:hypothetical protein MIR68_007856 [Amoeboaphelidium protococcarum]
MSRLTAVSVLLLQLLFIQLACGFALDQRLNSLFVRPQLQHAFNRFNDAVDTLDDPLYELCDDPASHVMTIKSITLDPNPPKIDQDIVIKLDGDMKKEVTSGKVKLDLVLGFIRIRQEVDLCDSLGQYTDTSCPLKQGNNVVTVRQHIPREIPPLAVKGNVKAYDQDGNLLTCVNIKFKFSR